MTAKKCRAQYRNRYLIKRNVDAMLGEPPAICHSFTRETEMHNEPDGRGPAYQAAMKLICAGVIIAIVSIVDGVITGPPYIPAWAGGLAIVLVILFWRVFHTSEPP